MGLRDALVGKRVYFDSNIFIYLIEGFRALESQLLQLRDCIASGESEIVTSELTLCEVLVAPFRRNDNALAARYRQFIEASGAFNLLTTRRQTYVLASLYRAQFGMKTPDAVHMATATEADCDVFVTNDTKIKAPRRMEVLSLSAA